MKVVGPTTQLAGALDVSGASSAQNSPVITQASYPGYVTSLTAKTTPVDGDSIAMVDSADSSKGKKVLWSAIKAALKNYFDTVYVGLTAAEISITQAATLTISRDHVVSGTAADYTVTLPPVSGNAGRRVSLRIAPGCTRLITVKGAGSEVIDGQNTRVMWACEAATLLCDGTAWSKVAGKTIPMSASMKRAGSAQSYPAGRWTMALLDTVVADNTASLAAPMASLSSGRIIARRPGRYYASGCDSVANADPLQVFAMGAVCDPDPYDSPTDSPNAWSSVLSENKTAGVCTAVGSGSGVFVASAGSIFATTMFNGNPTSVLNRTNVSCLPTLSVIEHPSW